MILTDKIKTEFLKSCERIEVGRITVQTPENDIFHFGQTAPTADIHIRDWRAISMTLSRGDIGFGEAYVLGYWESSSPEALLTLVLKNQNAITDMRRPSFWNALKFRFVDRLIRRNSKRGSARNIRQHYDVGNEFYQLWLDDTMTYSAALYDKGDNLEFAQLRKYDRILDRLGGEGERILEIGCGWGGFAKRAADAGRSVTGLTISPSQKGYAAALLDGRAQIELRDYRDSVGKYDHIVSIEMIEAVGQSYWPGYFATLRARLMEGGKVMLQAITVSDDSFETYRKNSDYIRQYTFPGGMLLSHNNLKSQAEMAGLKLTDYFEFGEHYGRTCQEWSARMLAERSRIQGLGYDERFIRSWRYYLDACAASFFTNNTNVAQLELQHA